MIHFLEKVWLQLFEALHHTMLDSSGREVSYKYTVRQNLQAYSVPAHPTVNNNNFKRKNS